MSGELTTVERVRAKADEAVRLTEMAGRLPWWHRKRRALARQADAAMREGFTILTEGKP